MVVLLAVITTTVLIVVAIGYFRRNKKRDKTGGTQIHHTSPIYDTIPDIQESSNNNAIPSSRVAIPRHTTALERQDQNNNNMMQQPNRHPVGSTRTRLEGHNNIMILDGNQQQRVRESIPISLRENEAYMYAVADQYQHMSAPVQETNPEDCVNELYPNKKDAENYIYPMTNKWVHAIEKD